MNQKIESTASPTKQKKSSLSPKGNVARNHVDTQREATHSALSAHDTPMSISSQDRRQMISEAAYFLAQKRAFNGEYQLKDWLSAEAEINTRFPMQ